MSFAEPWIKYLVNKKFMPLHFKLTGKRKEDSPYTQVSTSGDSVEQFFYGVSLWIESRMKIPDEINIEPTKVDAVEIMTTGPYRFTIKGKKITVTHTKEMPEETKDSMRKAAIDLKYDELEFEESSIVA